MTTIAWDGKTLAADRRAGGWMNVGKIFKLKDKSYIAGAGTYDQIIEVVTWLESGGGEESKPKLPEDDGSNLMWIRPDGTCYWLTWPYLRPVQFNETFAAVGSGSDFALGAMAAGATAKQAVEIACRFDSFTGKGVNTVRVVK